MEQVVISLLPEDQWQLARVIRFRYTHIDRPCNATVVYFLPFELVGAKHDLDLIDDRITDSLRSCFGEVSIFKRDVMFTTVKENLKIVHDGGRPKISLVIRMTPEIPVSEYPNYVGKTIYAYDYHLNIFLDYIGQIGEYSKDLLITVPYPLTKENTISWGANNIETL